VLSDELGLVSAMPPAISADTNPDSGRWSFPQRPPRHWYVRPCGHITGNRAHIEEPCPYCAENVDGFRQEQLLTVELDGVDAALRIAQHRRDARMAA
jgi:hypothetical protein